MRIKIFILALFISLNLWAQKEGFVIRGYIPGMPDGVKVTLMEKEGKRSTKAETIVKDERFELKGRVESPQAFMLIANIIINRNDMRAEKHMTGWNAITDAFLKLYPKQTIVYLTVSVIPF